MELRMTKRIQLKRDPYWGFIRIEKQLPRTLCCAYDLVAPAQFSGGSNAINLMAHSLWLKVV
jgi:hypothetical protein